MKNYRNIGTENKNLFLGKVATGDGNVKLTAKFTLLGSNGYPNIVVDIKKPFLVKNSLEFINFFTVGVLFDFPSTAQSMTLKDFYGHTASASRFTPKNQSIRLGYTTTPFNFNDHTLLGTPQLASNMPTSITNLRISQKYSEIVLVVNFVNDGSPLLFNEICQVANGTTSLPTDILLKRIVLDEPLQINQNYRGYRINFGTEIL